MSVRLGISIRLVQYKTSRTYTAASYLMTTVCSSDGCDRSVLMSRRSPGLLYHHRFVEIPFWNDPLLRPPRHVPLFFSSVMLTSGLKSWFEGCSIPSDRITELDWWHEAILTFSPEPTSGAVSDFDPERVTDTAADLLIKVAFTPAQHRSGRGVFDHMTTLWGSWCLGVVGEEEKALVDQRGMSGWKGFKMFFGG